MTNFNLQSKQELVITKFIDQKLNWALYDLGVGPKTEYLTLKKAIPNLKIFGTEPDPRQYNTVKLTFENLGGVLKKYAVSNETKKFKDIYLDPNNTGGTSFLRQYKQKVRVELITLDKLDTLFGKQENIILWMDIEGYELKALKSGIDLLRSKRVKLINLEVSKTRKKLISFFPSEDEINNYLEKKNFTKIIDYNFHSSHYDSIYKFNE